MKTFSRLKIINNQTFTHAHKAFITDQNKKKNFMLEYGPDRRYLSNLNLEEENPESIIGLDYSVELKKFNHEGRQGAYLRHCLETGYTPDVMPTLDLLETIKQTERIRARVLQPIQGGFEILTEYGIIGFLGVEDFEIATYSIFQQLYQVKSDPNFFYFHLLHKHNEIYSAPLLVSILTAEFIYADDEIEEEEHDFGQLEIIFTVENLYKRAKTLKKKKDNTRGKHY